MEGNRPESEETRWLVYGGRGWIGGRFCSLMSSEVVQGTVRCDQFEEMQEEIREIRPTHLLSFIGRTSGPSSSGVGDIENNTIDWLEKPGNLKYNLRDNLMGPLFLEQIAREEGLHFTYLGTGCIYTYGDHPKPAKCLFSERDPPNFTGSHYSTVKGVTDQVLGRSPVTLNVRLRMPVSEKDERKNLLSKLLSYPSIANSVNSISVLPDLLPILGDLVRKKRTGTYHLVNPGSISHREILELYQEHVDPSYTWKEESEEQVGTRLRALRSRCVLNTEAIQREYSPPTARESIIRIWKQWGSGE